MSTSIIYYAQAQWYWKENVCNEKNLYFWNLFDTTLVWFSFLFLALNFRLFCLSMHKGWKSRGKVRNVLPIFWGGWTNLLHQLPLANHQFFDKNFSSKFQTLKGWCNQKQLIFTQAGLIMCLPVVELKLQIF